MNKDIEYKFQILNHKLEQISMTKNTNSKPIHILLIPMLVVLFGINLVFGGTKAKSIILESRSFPNNLKEDGFWAAFHAGRDGKVYIGLNTEGGGSAQFYIYDPQTDRIRHRADMSEFLGEMGKGIRTHAKIHTKFVEDNEGRIYFATGNMGAGPSEVDPRSWAGGHWCCYNPRTDTLEDLGLVLPYNGIYGLTIDPVRMKLYGMSTHGHFLIFDLATRTTEDRGRVNYHPRSVARTLVIDDEGNVFGTYLPDRIFKYDVKVERLLDLSIQIPSDSDIFPRTHSIYKRYMRAGVWDDVNKKIYGVEGGTSWLFEYDPKAGKEGQVRKLAQLLPENEPDLLRRAHYATLSFTLGKDRKIYYLPIGPPESPEDNRSVDFYAWAGQAHLITYNLQTGQKQDLGRIFLEDDLRVIDFLNGAPSGGATTGPDGTVYFCAFVEERNPQNVGRKFGKIPARLRLLIYHPDE
jgi:hypothetical protein